MRDIRFVVIHTPGPAWQAGVPLFEQRGIAQHIDHFRTLLESGKLEMGGPFLDASGGGMMIPTEGLSQSRSPNLPMRIPRSSPDCCASKFANG